MKKVEDWVIGMAIWLLIASVACLGGIFYGYHIGQVGTYQKFQLGECWIGPESNDVICSIYVE